MAVLFEAATETSDACVLLRSDDELVITPVVL